MGSQFHSSWRRITRAKQKTVQLQKSTRRFFQHYSRAGVSEPDPENAQVFLHKIQFLKDLPESITDNTVEAIEHLRSALDLAAFAVATKKGSKGNKFPFGDSLVEFENNATIGSEFIPKDIVTLFRSFKPYKGGNDLLWALNKLCNVQKHRLIVPTGVLVGEMHIRELRFGGEGPAQILRPRWNPEKHEIVFARTGPKKTLKYDVEMSLTISFGEVEVVANKPVLAVLHALTGIVEGIVRATEAEAKRIGII